MQFKLRYFIIILFAGLCFISSVYSQEEGFVFPGSFKSGNSKKYPLYICMALKKPDTGSFKDLKIFDKKFLQDYADENEIILYAGPESIISRTELENITSRGYIDKNRIAFISQGNEGLRFLLHNPLFFCSSILLFSRNDLDGLFAELQNNILLPENINHEKVYFIFSQDTDPSQKDKIKELINKNDFPAAVKQETDAGSILKSGKKELDTDFEKLNFKTDNPAFTKCQWLEVLRQGDNPGQIMAELDDESLNLFSDSIDSFKIDFSHPVFEDIDDKIAIKFNYHTIYYSSLPVSKRLLVYDKVVLLTNENVLPAAGLKPISNINISSPPPEQISEQAPEKNIPIEITNKPLKVEEPVQVQTNIPPVPEIKAPETDKEIKSKTEPEIFIPGKGQVKIKFENIDSDEIKTWEIPIHLPDNSLFTTIKGKNDFENEIIWNGKDYKGILLPNGVDCSYRLKFQDKDGNMKQTEIFKIKTGLVVQEEKKRLSIEMQEVLFKKNSAEMGDDSKAVLDKVAGVVAQHKGEIKNIAVEGHSDNTGDKKFNLNLSEARAKSVLNFLVQSKAIDMKDIKSKGYGDSKPAYPNDIESNRRKNRRVNITIYLK